tara:strand:- start:207 stop:1322 length:1116 start_codon:yes stop_codon:yes gene_type:complete
MSIVSDLSELGYNKSTRKSAIDVMSMERISSPSATSIFNMGAIPAGFGVSDPVFGNSQPNFKESILGKHDNKTFMDKLHPGVSFKPVAFNVSANTIDASKKITNGVDSAKITSGSKEANQEIKAAAKQQHTKDIGQATDSLASSAKANGVSVGAAKDTLMPDSSSTKLTAAAYMVGDTMLGGGSLVTLGQGIFFGKELSKADKKLSVKEQESVLADSLKILQNTPAVSAQDTRRATVATIDAAASLGGGSKTRWDNFNEDDLKGFLAHRFEDLKEAKDLDVVDAKIKDTQDTQKFAAENISAVSIDAGDVELTGYALGGITKIEIPDMASNDAVFANVSDISAQMDQSKPVIPTLEKPSAYMATEMRAAFG